jgi:hypothetical protein
MRTALNQPIKRSVNTKSSNPALQIKPEFLPDLTSVTVSETTVACTFEDGRSVTFPVGWSDKLAIATPELRQAFEFNAHFIFWDELDEIIGVRNILFGKKLQWQ